MDKKTLTLKRTLNAPLKRVWDAWAQADQISKWWGPKGMETTVSEHDFKPGGSWKYSMLMPDGNAFITEGAYSEIQELEKIISSADFKPMTEGVEIQAHFEGRGDTTEFTFKVVHPTEEYCKQQEQMGFYKGWESTFDRLETFLNN